MTTITPELLADLRKKAEEAKGINPLKFYPGQLPQSLGLLRAAMKPEVVLALLDRIEALEKVAKAVRGITKDAAENGNCSDCPYVSMEEARELLTIIDGGDHA